MNRTISFRLFAPLLIAAVLAIVVIGLVRQAPAIQFDSPFGGRTRTAPIDTEVAAEQSALRWPKRYELSLAEGEPKPA